MVDSNPYRTSSVDTNRLEPQTRWRVAPTFFLGSCGCLFVFAGFAMLVAFCLSINAIASTTQEFYKGLAQGGLSIVAGILWMFSAYLCWNRKYEASGIAGAVGFVLILLVNS